MKKGFYEKIMTFKIEAWAFILMFILGCVFFVLSSWLVWHKSTGGSHGGGFGDWVMKIAKLPDPYFKMLLSEQKIQEVIQPQLMSFDGFENLKRYQSDFSDPGTLLISAYSDKNEVSSVFLYDLASEKILHQWQPPIQQILDNTKFRNEQSKKLNFRSQHPLLLDNGSILITSGEGPLLQMDACSQMEWVVDRHFHHSIERSVEGDLYVPLVSAKKDLPFPLRNDGFAKISAAGEISQEWSIYDILIRHGYDNLLHGFGRSEVDRIHLNDVEPIAATDEYVEKGDLMISVRNLSMVFLYRPSTDEILWLEIGPWLNQHDVDYLGNGLFSIYGNDMVRGEGIDYSFRGYNTIWQYDLKTAKVSELLALNKPAINTVTEGRHRVLTDGDIIVEETNAGLIHRVNKDGLVWSYTHSLSKGKIGALHWSRYLSAEESKFDWLENLQCSQK